MASVTAWVLLPILWIVVAIGWAPMLLSKRLRDLCGRWPTDRVVLNYPLFVTIVVGTHAVTFLAVGVQLPSGARTYCGHSPRRCWWQGSAGSSSPSSFRRPVKYISLGMGDCFSPRVRSGTVYWSVSCSGCWLWCYSPWPSPGEWGVESRYGRPYRAFTSGDDSLRPRYAP
jgi:hypothetical protein